MKNRVLAGLLLTSALCQATPTWSQATDDTVFLGTIRIEAADAQTLLGNDEITEEELENRNPATMADVFVGESSVTTSGGAAIAQRTFVNGLEESLLSVTIDGARQNKSAFHHTGNVLLDPALLKSVDVSEGIAPADAGPNALGGGIAYTTKDARDLLDGDDTFGGFYNLRAGTNGQDMRNTLTLFGQQSGFEWLFSGTRQSGDDYKDGDGATVPGTEPDLSDIITKLAYTTDTGKRLSFSASQTEDTGNRVANPGPFGTTFIRPGFANTFARGTVTPGPFEILEGLSRRTSYTLGYVDENPQGWFAPEIQLTYNEQDIDVIGATGTNTSVSGFVKNEFSIASGSVTAGLDFFRDTAEGASEVSGPLPPPLVRFIGTYGGKETHHNVGIFAQARQDLGERLSVSYGGRYDWQEFESADDQTFKDDGFSANAMVDFAVSDTFSFNAGIASTWGGYELGEAALINFLNPWTYDDFRASRAETARLGVRYDDGIWSASGALFRTQIDDLVERTGARDVTYDVQTEGVELSFGYTAGQGFVRANFTRADVTENDAPIGTTAFYRGRPTGSILALEAGYDIDDQWSVGGNAEIAFENDDAAITLEAYEVVNVYGAYSPRGLDHMELRLDVQNLFDATYVARNSDAADGALAVPLNNPGRTVALTARFEF
ncbi:MAG: TonB-dependent receptor [Pseudomonadota bacterium]